MKKYLMSFRFGVIAAMEYRFDFFMQLLATAFPILIQVFLWISLYTIPNEVIYGYTFEEMIIYVVIAGAVNVFVETGVERTVCNDIHSGVLGSYLHKPVNYIVFQCVRSLGRKIPQLFIMLFFSVTAIVVLCIVLHFSVNLWLIIVWVLAVVLALVLNLALYLLISFSGFWITKANYFFGAIKVTLSVLSGGVFPITIFGSVYISIFKWLPFTYTRYFPISLLSGALSVNEVLFGLIAQCTWTLVLLLISVLVWKHGLKCYTVVGG